MRGRLVGEGLREEVTTGSGPKGGEGGNRQGVLAQKNAGNRVSKPGRWLHGDLRLSDERKPLEAFGECVAGPVRAPRC